jgi:hypothetical protein
MRNASLCSHDIDRFAPLATQYRVGVNAPPVVAAWDGLGVWILDGATRNVNIIP